jgi:transcriptional regulator with XRE-family HTH domain
MLSNNAPSLGIGAGARYKALVPRSSQKQLAREIGQRLKEARERVPGGKLSQREAGSLAGFNSRAEDPQSRVSNYERGKRDISLADLTELAKVYGKSPVFLAFGVREFPDDEEQLLEDYRALSLDSRRTARTILESMVKDSRIPKRGTRGR